MILPFYHIKALFPALKVTTLDTAIKRLRELGIPVKGKGKNQYVLYEDIVKFFRVDEIEKPEKVEPKSKEAKELDKLF